MEEKTFFNKRWKAVEKIGKGTFGIKYRAVKQRLGIKQYSIIEQKYILIEDVKRNETSKSDIENILDKKAYEFMKNILDAEKKFEIYDYEVIKSENEEGRIINIIIELEPETNTEKNKEKEINELEEKYIKEIENEVIKEFVDEGILKLDENGKIIPKMGICYSIWSREKQLLKERYNIDWLTPAERNPEINYD